MASADPMNVTVLSMEDITPNMRRVVFGGGDLVDFDPGFEGGYIKLIFPDAARVHPDRPIMRSYSIRAHDTDANELTVDFAMHGDAGGIATDWVTAAKPGDTIPIRGPGRVKMVDNSADWFLLAGDMTAFPALLCNFEMLKPDAKGHAVIEITSAADKQDIPLPAGMTVEWVINPHPEEMNGALEKAVRSVRWGKGTPFVWTACEFQTMRALRGYYRERGVTRDQMYLSSYWKSGSTDEQHKAAKQKDSVADKAAEAA